MALLVPDGRSERNHLQVSEKKSVDMWFERLEQLPATTQHLLVVFAVPFSFIRVRVAEKLFGFLKNQNPYVFYLSTVNFALIVCSMPSDGCASCQD